MLPIFSFIQSSQQSCKAFIIIYILASSSFYRGRNWSREVKHMLRVTDCKLLSWDLKQGIQLQGLGSPSLAASTFVPIPPFFGTPPSSKHILLLSPVYCPPLWPCYAEGFWFLSFCFLFLEDPFLIYTHQRSSRPSSNALDRTSYLESLSFLYLWFFPFFRGCCMFSREIDVLPNPLSNLPSAGGPYRPTSVGAINQTFLSLYFFFFFFFLVQPMRGIR